MGLSFNWAPYEAFPHETIVKAPAGSLRTSQPNFSHITFWLQLWLWTQTKMSQEDINLNFASLPCYNSNWRLKEKLTKFICRKFQYRAQRKASEIEICQKFQLEWWRQFIQLKFIETQLGTGSNTSQIKLC